MSLIFEIGKEYKNKVKEVQYIDVRNALKELEPFIKAQEKQMTLLV